MYSGVHSQQCWPTSDVRCNPVCIHQCPKLLPQWSIFLLLLAGVFVFRSDQTWFRYVALTFDYSLNYFLFGWWIVKWLVCLFVTICLFVWWLIWWVPFRCFQFYDFIYDNRLLLYLNQRNQFSGAVVWFTSFANWLTYASTWTSSVFRAIPIYFWFCSNTSHDSSSVSNSGKDWSLFDLLLSVFTLSVFIVCLSWSIYLLKSIGSSIFSIKILWSQHSSRPDSKQSLESQSVLLSCKFDALAVLGFVSGSKFSLCALITFFSSSLTLWLCLTPPLTVSISSVSGIGSSCFLVFFVWMIYL